MAFFLTTLLTCLYLSTLGHSAPSQLFVFTPDFISSTSIAALEGWISPGCLAAMGAPVACDPSLRDRVVGSNGNEQKDKLSLICTDTCEQSLAHYHDSVLWACRHDPDPWPGVSATAFGDSIWINYNYTCENGPMVDVMGTSHDYDYPLDQYPYAIVEPPDRTSSADDASDNTYPPKPLNMQHKFKRDMVKDNGKTAAAPTCQQYTIQPGDTCWKIANTYKVTLAQLRAWNSFINSDCTNLIIGDQICVSDPTPSGTVTAPTTTASTPYATATVAPPGPTARGTTPKCGRYYLAQSGDYCQRIVANAGISMELFKAINPDINADCTNLISGLWYCTLPTSDWNKPSTTLTTTTSSYVSAPAPTSSGTTPNCYEWYVVQQGDYCAKLVSQFGITLAQLQQWNPELNVGCTNLIAGYAYCVHGESSSNRPKVAAATATNRMGDA